MMQVLEIQACAVTDATHISEIAIEAYRDFYLYLWKDDGSWYINRSFSPKQIKTEIKDPNARYYALKVGGDTIGFLKLNLDQPLDGHEQLNAIELERIYLLKAFAGKGFGRQAMEFCFGLAREMRKDLIWLKSMDSSPAIHFYEQLGFDVCGTFRLDYEAMKPEFRGMKILVKKLL